MDIGLGRRADYSLRGVFHLARHDDGAFRSARAIAEATAVPATWLPQLLTTLAAAGVVESATGRRGGYRLARPPARVTVLEVVQAVEPDPDPVCVLRGGPCNWDGRCAFHEPWVAAKQAFTARLADTTFADVVALDDLLADAAGGREVS
ncbi:RrF2 family transcriptional regulator [Salsipaludibacter albus]|uniref:RrF2 family transcriptional regulator n=1 Tax=Salsipaludibacter albus TaxID=2849650 RepID=UPI001EE3DCBC|nr:Rrf2 family transcriptional regulator [Salsipaludibacter albus]MBY5163938.1 Rrf2 family transcriptional regulator [Salsipaludibacter albus]